MADNASQDRVRDAIEGTTRNVHDSRWRILVRRQGDLWDEGVKAGAALEEHHVSDITPTVLALCGLPVGLVFVPMVPGSILPLGIHFYGQVIMFAAFLMVRTTMEDRVSGVLARIGVAPVSHFRYLWETLLAYGLLLVAQNALIAGLGSVVYGGTLKAPLLQFVALSCFSLTSIASPTVTLTVYSWPTYRMSAERTRMASGVERFETWFRRRANQPSSASVSEAVRPSSMTTASVTSSTRRWPKSATARPRRAAEPGPTSSTGVEIGTSLVTAPAARLSVRKPIARALSPINA